MVNEREPPKASAYPVNNAGRQQEQNARAEFGRPSQLGSAGFQPRNPFNIPKTNSHRPEHHRAPAPSQQNQQPPLGRQPQLGTDVTKLGGYYNRTSSAYDNDDSVIEIFRPSNENHTTKAAPTPIFSSKPKPKPSAPPLGKSSSNIQNFVDLTSNQTGFSTNTAHRHQESGSMEAYSYVDATKANENIKALLEGAFEDEDDKPRTRGQKKKKMDKQVADLAGALQGVSMGDEPDQPEPGDIEPEQENDDDEDEDDGAREGLKVKLLPHQIEGVDWMKDKEVALKKTRGVLPRGGILADDMGLGKTIQTIALMLCNPRPPLGDTDEKTDKSKSAIPRGVDKGTLVVAPVALMKQWEAEIESRIAPSHRMRVCVYHGAGRTKYAEDLKDYDVVVTTYGTLSSEHAQSMKNVDGERTGCFGVHWYRIVLDEAHTIKNRNAKVTQAVYALNSEYRWCLTGTPMQNNLDELQSLIRFLRLKPYDDLAAWRDQITRPLNNGRGGLAIRRLRVYLKAFMKRRTKDVLNLDSGASDAAKSEQPSSKPSSGFQITKRDVLNIEADFTSAEREFYTRLEQRTDKSLENMIGKNNLSYASALVLLLRLRQACNHPDLVKGDLAQEKESLDQPKESKNDDMDNIADMLGGLSVVTKRCDVCQNDLTKQEASSGSIRCTECEGDLKSANAKQQKRKEKKKKNAKSHHESSARKRRNRPIVIDSDDEDGAEWIVPEGERHGRDLGVAGGKDEEDAEAGGEWLGSDDSQTDEDGSEDEEGLSEQELEDEASQMMASTKVRRLMKILRHEANDHKFIVFSVFTSMLDKIEPFLKRANVGYARYDGQMRNDLREASLHKLRNSKDTRVLLCSLRAGSLGLNLTAASRVVILEPFWNPFVEEQAIDRVHRLNQTVDVKVYKMTVKDTVEARILNLQERKRELAKATIEGKTAAGKLTMKDMLALFKHDAETKYSGDRDMDSLDLSGKTRLLEEKNEGSSTSPPSTGVSAASQRSSPPVMENGRKDVRPVQESSVYGRRW